MPRSKDPESDEAPKESAHRCRRCGVKSDAVMYDRPLEEWLCGMCWVNTRPPG